MDGYMWVFPFLLPYYHFPQLLGDSRRAGSRSHARFAIGLLGVEVLALKAQFRDTDAVPWCEEILGMTRPTRYLSAH